jgi:hypothetical protein
MASKSRKKSTSDDRDLVWVCARSEDGNQYGVVRQRGTEVQAGVIRPLTEGKPIQGEVVRLRPRDDSPVLFDVEVQHAPDRTAAGPPHVSTESYRRGWESIWASKPRDRTLN